MPKTYRIAQLEPRKYDIQMATVSGWINVDSTTSKSAAMEIIRQKKEIENFTPKFFDVDGNEVSADQSLDNA